MSDSPEYIAVIGDLVASRELPDRAAVQRQLHAVLEELNERFAGRIVSRFLITVGDEFQGLLRLDAAVDALWWRFMSEMHASVQTRFGFGVGPLSTPVLREAVGMDGPCFHAAREAISRCREEERLLGFEIHQRPAESAALNAVGLLLDRIVGDWTRTQWETISALAEVGSQAEVARTRGVTRQSVRDVVQSKTGRGEECIASWRGLAMLLRSWADSGRKAEMPV